MNGNASTFNGNVAGIGLLVVLVFAPSDASAQNEWPNRAVEIIVPSSPGSGPDAVIRNFTDHLSKSLKQPVVVNNRPGGQGVVAAQAAARAQADGYTFMAATSGQLVVNKHVIRNLPYDPEKDFVPVALVNRAPFYVLANPWLPVKTLGDLVTYSRANRGKVNFAYESAAAKAASAYLNDLLKSQMALIPYVNPSQALQDLVGGSVQVSINGAPMALSLLKNEQVRALAVTTQQRSDQLPDVPAISESYPEFGNFETWLMVLAPKGTPKHIVDRMSAELGRISRIEEVRQIITKLGTLTVENTSPAAAVKFLSEQNAQFAKMAAAASLQAE